MEILGNLSILSSYQTLNVPESLEMLLKRASVPNLSAKILGVNPLGFIFVLIWNTFRSDQQNKNIKKWSLVHLAKYGGPLA